MTYRNEIVDFSVLKTEEIKDKLSELNIPLTVSEALKIQTQMLKRPPSITELVLFSIQGSEHCSYKSSRTHLKNFVTTGPDVILGAKEDAGVISITKDKKGNKWCIVMSHESHNHPSQIVPYEGAATGVGGNVRDVMCMGAEVISNSDSLRFGNLKNDKTKWIHDGVIAGIAGYGNPIGVPNVGGDLYYNNGYDENCLVTLTTLGIIREDEIIHSFAPKNAAGYDLILVGKPTDNSGFGGASFASLELEEEKAEKNKGAVQEPNAFLERHLLKSSYELFKILKEKNLISQVGFKDLGAGGVACASVELAETSGFGAEVWVDKIPVSMKDLHPSVVLCSETQERFMWVCEKEISPIILDHYNVNFNLPQVSKGAKASVIGRITKDKQYTVYKGKEKIIDAPAEEVTKGFIYDRPIKEPKRNFFEPSLSEPVDYNKVLLDILNHQNIASRQPVFEKYDKQVQGRVLTESGEADSCVLSPFNSKDYPKEIRNTGIAISTDHNPRYGLIDPYWCGINSVVEAMRNVACVGATPHAISDCLCFGNPEKPEQMWEFVQSVNGIKKACDTITLKDHKNHPVPIIAGNVSFYNESKSKAIPPSPIISCLGKLENVNKSIGSSFISTASNIILVGERKNELGGSVYYELNNELGKNVPKPDLKEVKNQIFALIDCINSGLVLSCHDISDGGIACALSEMTFKNQIGAKINIDSELREDQALFSETGGFLLEIEKSSLIKIRSIFSNYGLNVFKIGKTNNSNQLIINKCINISLKKTTQAWTNGLRDKLK